MHEFSRDDFLHWFDDNRHHSSRLFECVAPEAYTDRPIELRHPIVFYEGHLSAFNFITLVRRALGGAAIDERLESLFERGIDPEEPAANQINWPRRSEVLAFTEECDRRVRHALEEEPLEDPLNPYLRRSEAVFTMLEHENMHHETLRYMFHQLPYDLKKPLFPERVRPPQRAVRRDTIRIPAGRTTLGAKRGSIAFGWDNEFEESDCFVHSFTVDRHPVTNSSFLDFVLARGYDNPDFWDAAGWEWRVREEVHWPRFWEKRDHDWYWRGMWELSPLPPESPVYVSHAEAQAYAKWSRARLMTEAEYHRAAFSTPTGEERLLPFGDERPSSKQGWFDFAACDPVCIGSHPDGASAWGVEDLVGNGWEWTSTTFAPFDGFRPMVSYPPYSTDFFDGAHFVMKGASPATSSRLVRRSFRNWFRPNYPYVYAKFRCVTP